MFVENDVKFIAFIEHLLIEPIAEVCLRADWDNQKYNRYEETLVEGRLCTLPYAIRREEHRTYTEDQLEIISSVQPIIDEIAKIFPYLIKVRGEVVNLLPNRQLDLHIDNYWFHEHSKRIHVPIITNDRCYQIFEDREVHLDVGSIYEINNRILHSAYNKGNTARIHLIVDLMSQENADKALRTKGLALSKI